MCPMFRDTVFFDMMLWGGRPCMGSFSTLHGYSQSLKLWLFIHCDWGIRQVWMSSPTKKCCELSFNFSHIVLIIGNNIKFPYDTGQDKSSLMSTEEVSLDYKPVASSHPLKYQWMNLGCRPDLLWVLLFLTPALSFYLWYHR